MTIVTGDTEGKDVLCCSFCEKDQNDVKKLIAGPDVYICNECVELCLEIVREDNVDVVRNNQGKVLTPKDIYKTLNEYVIGQDQAKRTLAVAVYNHYKRLSLGLGKANVLMIGSTGSGKTLLAQTLARILDVPFTIADATTLTEAGYVGDDVENMVSRLLQVADYDIERAQRGIIFIDEIDKISRKSGNPSITRDVSGEGVQQALLKLMEGTIASVSQQGGGRKHPQQDFLQVDTTNILFICSGSFDGLEKIISTRSTKSTIGFGADLKKESSENYEEILSKLEVGDLIKYGLIPELVGRLPVITVLNSLDKDMLVDVLEKPKNSLTKQYKKLFDMDSIELEFTRASLEAVANQAIERKTGARGLRAIMEDALLSTMFEVPSKKDIKKIIVDEDVILKNKKPEIVNIKSKDKSKKEAK